MNTKNLFKIGALLVVLSVLSLATVFGQTVYVDVTNGSDTYTGANATNSPAGTGPKATINAGIGALTNGGTLVIFAGTYNGGDGAGGAINITTTTLTGITFEFRSLNSNQEVLLSAGAFTYNVNNGTLTIAATNGTEYMTINGLTLGSSGKNSMMNLPVQSYLRMASGNTITLWQTSGFTNQAPQKTTNIQLSYQGGTSLTAGPESNYGSYGTGTITVNKTAGTSVTFPNAITAAGGIAVTSGDATFSAAVTLGTRSVVNSSTGTVTFTGALGLGVANTEPDLGTIVNSSTGTISVNGGLTWTGTNTGSKVFNDVAGQYAIENSSTGTVSVNSAVSLVASDGGAGRSFTITAYNNGGSLTLGAVTAAATTTNSNSGTLNVFNAAVANGTASLAGGTIRGYLFTGGGATTTLTGAATVSGIFTNAGTTALGGNVLTLSGGVAHATTGGTVTATTGGIVVSAGGSSFNGGTLSNLTINHGTAGTTTTSGTINVSSLTATSGTLSVGAAFTVATAGTTTLNGGSVTVGNFTFTTGSYSQSAGTFTLANNSSSKLDVKGNFTRTAGTFSAGLASVTSFTGTSPQSFNGGPLITVGDLSFANSGGTITLGQSVRVQGSCTINTSTNLDLSTLNIILIGNASAITNSGSYSASGGGGVIFGGSTTVSGGLAATAQTIAGTGTYSYITVDVGNGNDVTMSAANAVKFNGVLTLTTGNIQINNAGGSFGPSGTSASIIRNLKTGAGSDKGIYITAGQFNPAATAADYDLQYTGAMTASNTLNDAAANGREFTLANVKNLTFSTTQTAGATQTETRLEWVASGAVTIKGNLTLSAPSTGNVNQVLAPSQDVTVKGTLSVAAGAHLIASDNTKTFTLDADSKTHSVAGKFDVAHGIANVGHTIQVTGNGSALNGSSVAGDAAQIANLAFEPAGNNYTFTSSNLKTITGSLTIEGTSTKTGASATISMDATTSVLGGNLVVGNSTLTPAVSVTIAGTTTSTHTGNLTLTNGTLTYTRGGAGSTIGGTVTLTAGTLTLGSSVTVNGATTVAAGNLVMGANSYTQVGSGASPDFNRTGAGTLTATTGALILDATSANIDLTPGATFSVPRLTFKAGNTTINAAMTVSDVLVNTAGAVTLSGALTFSGNTHTFTAGSYAGSALTYTGSNPTATFAASVAINSITVNSAGTLTIASSSTTARTITVAGTFTQTAGTVALGINSLTVTGTFTRAAGSWTMGTGYLVFNTATAFTQGTGFAVDNLQISQSISASPTSTAFTVNKNLKIVGGTLTVDAGKLTLGDGCLVERQADAAMLSSVPTFAGAVSVSYTTAGPISTAANFNELPSTVTNFSVVTPSSVTLPKNVTVNGTLTLSGVLTTVASTKNITMANGSTLVLQAAGTTVLPVTGLVLPASPGSINITYDGTFAVSTRELGTVTSGAYDLPVNNVTFKSGTTTLDNNLTIAGTTTFSGGTFAIAAKTVTVQGSITQSTAGSFFTSTATGTVQFTGAAAQTLTLKADLTWPATTNFKISKTNATDAVTIAGGSIDFATNVATSTVTFTKGLLVTGANTVTFGQGNTGTQPTQGYTRVSGHVVGNVKKFVNNATANSIDRSRVEFPTGTADGNFRPFAIYFKNTPQTSVNITVSHSTVRPGGQNGYPIRDGGLVITNYPSFFWYVKSDISLAPSYLFDMEAQAENYLDYAADGIQNLRFVRRDSGLVSNQWVMQKNNNTNTVLYDNSTINAGTTPVVKVVDATGGITTQGSIFTYSQINKAPSFVAPTPTSMTKNEGDTLSVTFAASDPDLGDLATMSSVTLPTGATFNATTGVVTWVIGYDLATKTTPTATQTIKIRATDTYGPLSKDTTITITINNTNRKPSFTATGAAKLAATTIKDGQALSFTYIAVDADGDAVTYVGVGLPTGATLSTAGALAWTPTFAQAGSNYTITVVASDAALTDTATAVVTVNKSRALGDVDGNGTVQAADASLVLQHVAGLATITDAAALYAADASKNGTISAYDAALILQAAAGIITLQADADVALGKVQAASGTLAWTSPEMTKEADVVKVNLNIANAANVYAVQLSGKVDANAFSIDGVSASLPEGWEMQWNVVDNELRVAMAGATPLPSGSVAAVAVRMKSKESRLSFAVDALLNEAAQSVGAVEIAAVPMEFALAQNYPNPFNPSTTIKYQIPNDASVNLVIYNLQGQQIRTLVAKEQKAGYYSVVWDGRNEAGQTVSSGLYLYRVQAGSFVATHKMLMIK